MLNKKQIISFSIIILFLTFLFCFYYIANSNKENLKKDEVPQQERDALLSFEDRELGISFQYSKEWGEALLLTDFSFTQARKKIIFSNNPDVVLEAYTGFYQTPASFTYGDVAHTDNLKEYCLKQKAYVDTSGQKIRERNDNGEDQFRINGSYIYGNCTDDEYVLYRIQKHIKMGMGGSKPLSDSTVSTSTLNLQKTVYWDLNNDLYKTITLKVQVGEEPTDKYCVRKWGGENGELMKSYNCINHEEKNIIENYFSNFERNKRGEDVKKLIDTLTVLQQPNGEEIYKGYYKNKRGWTDPSIDIQFDYPEIMHKPLVSFNNKNILIKFSEEYGSSFIVQVSEFKDLPEKSDIRSTDNDEGAGGWEPWLHKTRWDEEKKLLESDVMGEIECRDGAVLCKIEKVGDNKMYVSYFDAFPWTSGIRKEYAFYHKDRRYDIIIDPNEIKVKNIEEYKKIEEENFGLIVANEIVESIKLR